MEEMACGIHRRHRQGGQEAAAADCCCAREETEGLGLGEPRVSRSEGSPLCFLEGLTCGLAGVICLSWVLGYRTSVGRDLRMGSSRDVGCRAEGRESVTDVQLQC